MGVGTASMLNKIICDVTRLGPESGDEQNKTQIATQPNAEIVCFCSGIGFEYFLRIKQWRNILAGHISFYLNIILQAFVALLEECKYGAFVTSTK